MIPCPPLQPPARLIRQRRTMEAMIRLHCRAHHGTRGGVCADCQALQDYSAGRVDHCPFGAQKPTCAKCPIHCYRPAMRDQIRAVMRYAGPRMLWRHPILALEHLWDGLFRRPKRRLGPRFGRATVRPELPRCLPVTPQENQR